MFKKIFEYAGPYKKNMYVATVVVLVSVLMGILPFVLNIFGDANRDFVLLNNSGTFQREISPLLVI